MENEDSLLETKETLSSNTQIKSRQEESNVCCNSKRSNFNLLSVINIHPLLFCIFLADGLSASVVVNFIIDRSCRVHFNFNSSVCSILDDPSKNGTELEESVQPYASLIITGMGLLSTILPVFMSLFLGAWSDRNGRKLLLVLPALGYSIKFFLLAIFSLIPSLHPTVLFLVEIPVAFSGGVANFITAAFAYACDISKSKNCSVSIGIVESVMLCGNIIGYLSSAPLYNAAGPYAYVIIFGLSSALIFGSALYTYLFVPESIQSVENGKGVWHMFDLDLLKEMIKACLKKREHYRRAVIFLLIAALSTSISAMTGENNVKFLFTRLKFNWNIRQYTEWIAITDATVFLGFILGTIILKKCIEISDAILGILCYIVLAASELYIALVPSKYPYLMYFAGVVKMFSGFIGPAGRSLISKSVPSEDLGKVFALTTSTECIIPLAVAPLYTLLYNYTLNTFPETIFFLSAGIFCIDILFFAIVHIIRKKYKQPEHEILIENEVIG